MTSSALTTYHNSSPSHQTWDSALADVLSVLRIQYRNDDDVMLFLTEPDKLKQLQYSTAAKMEWNRRVIKEEMDSGIHSPPRSRRIAKEVAIDYIRRYLDGEEERMDLVRKIQVVTSERNAAMESVIELEREMKRLKDESVASNCENDNLKGDIEKLRTDVAAFRTDNQEFRTENLKTKEENEHLRGENTKLRDENKKLRLENQDLRNENGALRSENQKVRGDNVKLRDETGDMRSENMKLRNENQAVRDENQEVRCENLKVRDNNLSLRGENDRFRSVNEALLSENKRYTRDTLELNAREDEMRMLVNVMQSLLAGKGEMRSESIRVDEQAEEEDI
uniref:Coiled-coil domain-containing protein 89-like n=1 Tax=Ciona intestinalis TaxID=7719 RepID=F6VWA2_CIOIN|nr:coiled-coil domain-containing protein 89-like [Ciona intestinalis]|eukprot:XP_002124728.2 coiled-coil domain-containing protein 89-like [Ciona intestinalis]